MIVSLLCVLRSLKKKKINFIYEIQRTIIIYLFIFQLTSKQLVCSRQLNLFLRLFKLILMLH